jgi:hypothetical protein
MAAGVARADPPGKGVLPVHVVAIKSDTSYDQADALTAAVRSRVRSLHGYSLGDGDFALEVLMLGLKCGDVADEACQAKIANQIHADRYFWGTVEHTGSNKQVVADLHLWVRGQPPASTRLTYSDNLTAPGDESLRRLVDDALKKLLGTGQPSAEIPAVPVAEATKIKPAATVAPAVTVLPPPAPPPVTEEGSSRHTIGWVGVGIGAAFLGAGLYSVVRLHDVSSNDGYQRYLQGFPSNVNACDQARMGVKSTVPGAAPPTEMRDFCSEITTWQTLEVIFFGAAAISTGAGIYLLATDSSPRAAQPAPRVQVGASVGPGGGDLRLRMRF